MRIANFPPTLINTTSMPVRAHDGAHVGLSLGGAAAGSTYSLFREFVMVLAQARANKALALHCFDSLWH
jgi:hypothetical protein